MESYFTQAWNSFMKVVSWMKDTTILTVGGNDVTFLGLLIFCAVFNLILWVIYEILGLVINIAGE